MPSLIELMELIDSLEKRSGSNLPPTPPVVVDVIRQINLLRIANTTGQTITSGWLGLESSTSQPEPLWHNRIHTPRTRSNLK